MSEHWREDVKGLEQDNLWKGSYAKRGKESGSRHLDMSFG